MTLIAQLSLEKAKVEEGSRREDDSKDDNVMAQKAHAILCLLQLTLKKKWHGWKFTVTFTGKGRKILFSNFMHIYISVLR